MSTIPALRHAVEERYSCLATLARIVHVVQPREDGSAWDGPVAVFTITGNSSADTACAWYDPSPAAEMPRLHAVLLSGPVDSPETAVRLSMGCDRSRDQAS